MALPEAPQGLNLRFVLRGGYVTALPGSKQVPPAVPTLLFSSRLRLGGKLIADMYFFLDPIIHTRVVTVSPLKTSFLDGGHWQSGIL